LLAAIREGQKGVTGTSFVRLFRGHAAAPPPPFFLFSANANHLYILKSINRFWFSPEFRVLLAAIRAGQKGVTGTSFVRLFRGHVMAVARTAPHALYDKKIASFDETGGFDPADSEGFIKYEHE
jgi:argininosuccinate synthase